MISNLPEDELPNQLSSVDTHLAEEIKLRHNLWHSNYHEASIYIEEGLNNDKFENHPRKRATMAASAPPPSGECESLSMQPSATASASVNQTAPLIACVQEKQMNKSCNQQKHNNGYLLGGQYTTIETYILVHNRYFYQLDLAASVVLLLLALVEEPAVEGYRLSPAVHTSIEIFALGIIAVELLLKFRWMGPKRFFHHGRTVIKLVILLTMNVEAITVFLRHATHARFTRSLRPIFLVDNHYCHGIRRAIRQIFQSLPPILDMFTLALFFMFVFSIFGFYLFASNNVYFSDMPATVGNLLILATTANLPDVMMPSYAVSRWSTIFFVLFIIVHLFLLTNLTMAAVYESFTRKEKEKFHKLLLHRRKACQKAFKLLVSRKQPNRIQYRQFMGLMRYLNRKCSMFDSYLIFKALDSDQNGGISLEQFYQIYDFINLEWKMIYPETNWYDDLDYLPKSFKRILSRIQRAVNHKYFEWTVDILIVAAAFLQFIEATTFEFNINNQHQTSSTGIDTSYDNSTIPVVLINQAADVRPDSISTSIFIFLFTFESVLRCLAMGLEEYWNNGWNRLDVLVITTSICGLVTGYFGYTPFSWVIVMRVLRVMRLFEFKRRYRDIWQTLTYILAKRFVSMTCVVMILYYFFAILGMELLGDYDLRNCCKNTSLESQFNYDNSTEGAKYYLNDFGDIVASYLTLFSMSSNTYWLATMSAYAIVSKNEWIRLFFGVYYLCSIIVMNIVIAFILESFLFRIQYRSKMGKNCDDTNLFTVRVTLSSMEVDFLMKNLSNNPYSTQRRDKNLEKLKKRIIKEQLNSSSLKTVQIHEDKPINEKVSLLHNKSIARPLKRQNADNYPNHNNNISGCLSNENKRITSFEKRQSIVGDPDARWYLIYQAEQIRNKFSFTMKMYSDEVEGWLAEAEREDQDEMSAMISRNQIRAEHVAMARLVRKNIALASINEPRYILRNRSYSSSGTGTQHMSNRK